MREFEIIDHSREKRDLRDEVVTPERLAELYPGREIFNFWDFVKNLKKSGRSEFAVSRAKESFATDPDLMFFRVGEGANGVHPEVTFLGKNVAKGSIEIWNRFAAETWGYSVLMLDQKKKPQKHNQPRLRY